MTDAPDGTGRKSLHLDLLPEPVALCRFAPDTETPPWTAAAADFLTLSRTREELSVVVDERVVPAGVEAARGYRVLRVRGPLALELVGVVAALALPLAEAGVPVFPIATYETDYVLVRGRDLARALESLRAAGHTIDDPARRPRADR